MTIRRFLATLVSVLMLTSWAIPAAARTPPVAYPTVTGIAFTWTPADSTGTCHMTATATLSTPVTTTTRVTAVWSITAISPAGETWVYRPFWTTPPVGATTLGPWAIGACSVDGARYVSTGVDLYQGTRIGSRSQPYSSWSRSLPGYVCTAR
ncbi:MAG TPA: hypothetical protein VF143_01380 [Candidatus Nanopelagicales bacterium]